MSIRYFYRPNVEDFDHIIEPVDLLKFLNDNYYKVKQIFSIDEDVNETITDEKHKLTKKIIDVFTINKPEPIDENIINQIEMEQQNTLDSINTAAEGFDVGKFYNMKDGDSIGKFKSLFSFE